MTASNFSEIMKEEATKLPGKTKTEPPALSTEDQEVKQLENKRTELKKKSKCKWTGQIALMKDTR